MKEVVQKLLNRLEKEKAREQLIKEQLSSAIERTKKTEQYHENTIKARSLLQQAAENTQKIIEVQMSTLVTSALDGIFPDPYKFVVRFEQKRNRTECNLLFEKNGDEFNPIVSSGGGPLDIASFALRVAFWCIQKNTPTIILDEPFRFLSVDLQPKAGELLKRLSEELNIQFIIITHLEELLPYGDNVININKGEVKEMKYDN